VTTLNKSIKFIADPKKNYLTPAAVPAIFTHIKSLINGNQFLYELSYSHPSTFPAALMADPLHSDVNFFSQVPQWPFQLCPDSLQAHGFQALNSPTILTLEVRMHRVMLAGQFVITGSSSDGKLPNNTPLREFFQDTIDGNLINLPLLPEFFQDFRGRHDSPGGSDNFQ
jgi:hypothetical protein